jgi:hypothetical protein
MDERIRERRKDVRRWRGRRRMAVVAAIASVVALVALFVVLRSADVFVVRRVIVSPTTHVTVADVRVAVASAAGVNLLRLSTADLEKRLRALPYVRNAHVYRHFPDALEVTLTEYEPQAVVEVKGGGRWLVAGDGRVLASAANGSDGLVLVSAAAVDPPAPGATLPKITLDALSLARLLQDPKLWPPKVAAGRVVLDGQGDLTVALSAGGLVHLGDGRQLQEKLMAAVVVINQYLSQKKTIEYIEVQDPTRGVGLAK